MRTRAEVLYREHGPALFRYLVRLTGDVERAEDVLHDTFERLMERPPKDGSSVKGWLFRVATNRARDVRRADRRRLQVLGQVDASTLHAEAPPSPSRAVGRIAAQDRIGELFEGLKDRDRAILLMREEGFTHREIAEAVGTTTGSVGTLIARALDRVMKAAAAREIAS